MLFVLPFILLYTIIESWARTISSSPPFLPLLHTPQAKRQLFTPNLWKKASTRTLNLRFLSPETNHQTPETTIPHSLQRGFSAPVHFPIVSDKTWHQELSHGPPRNPLPLAWEQLPPSTPRKQNRKEDHRSLRQEPSYPHCTIRKNTTSLVKCHLKTIGIIVQSLNNGHSPPHPRLSDPIILNNNFQKNPFITCKAFRGHLCHIYLRYPIHYPQLNLHRLP